MKLTDIFKFKLFERTDPVDMETVNENFESVEKIFDGLTAEDVGAVATKGNTADNTVAFTTASERTKISSGETHATLFGKIARWIADLKTVAFSGNYNDLSNKPTIPTVANNNTTTEAGYALDARQANPNVEGSLGAQISALNSGLVNLQTVPEKYKDVAQHFINNIYPALSSDTQNIHSGVFAQNGYIGYSGVKAQSNYASFILHGYNYPALHLVCNDSQWLSLLLDNYNW